MISDSARESIISTLAILSQAHGESQEVRHYWFQLMREEIAKRSPEQIALMEKERGIERQLRGAA